MPPKELARTRLVWNSIPLQLFYRVSRPAIPLKAYIDFPVEVKSEENLRAKSLKSYCEKYKPV